MRYCRLTHKLLEGQGSCTKVCWQRLEFSILGGQWDLVQSLLITGIITLLIIGEPLEAHLGGG